MGLSAPAEIPIYVCTILYSCSFNNHIHYQQTVIKRARKKEKKKEKLCNWVEGNFSGDTHVDPPE